MTTQQVVVGAYTLLAKIGEGGMGVVHLARGPQGDRVALKVLRPHIVGDDEARHRLAREVSSLSRVRSRWVAEVVDADPWAVVPFVATRYVPGLSLHDHVVEEGPITGADLIWFAASLAEGLASVHAAGVLHRDVKPSNVLMEGRTPILIDFGLARVADDPKLTHTGWLLGTPGYLAPEILYGDDATPASDVHSWAATVAYAGTGRPPFGRGPSMAIMDRVRRGEHDVSGLPDDLAAVVEAALDPEPDRRPTLDQLLAWLRPQVGRGRPVPPPLPDPEPEPDLDPIVETLPVMLARPDADSTHTRPFETLVDPGVRDEDDEPTVHDWDVAEYVVPRPSAGERFRRATLLLGAALATGAGFAAYPWVATVVTLVLVWLLRSGSLAASKAGDRRRLRGRKWYDGVQVLLGAPWDLVRSIPGTVVLVLWSLGLAIAGALLCYAVAASVPATLFVCGSLLAAALWLGPGGSRVRGPVSRVADPTARSVRGWLAGLVVLAVLGCGLGALVQASGTSWTPDDGRPFDGFSIPDGGILSGR
ncbi:protein kinase [Nocardioides sp. zg-579]|uniref:Protein kinase n=1 Tax=Nocardioides marmotae TaxID=2663857 RepID=A0A6I3JGK1_9ACTN|nr:serine/threonine-protein kinase [Nocardioides marmotae]MCR6033507.1 protein kinase [Gordonia jinghuaiqii]MTB97165.1 protein kinase [Nocardioides marmotae]QKE00812.1 serine/threonine protein kinase [Nocardioides marmotae]